MSDHRHKIPDLDRDGLRQFSFVTSGIIAGLFGIVLPWLFNLNWPRWPWILAGVLVAVGLVAPLALKPVYKSWMRFGLLLSRITTPIIMGLVFYLIITPIGLIRRMFATDSIARKFNDEDSYRIRSKKAPPKNMERPF